MGIALGATWDLALIEEIGRALAAEAHSKGARVLLAPTVNLHRSPLNGRNFECYAEDPFLTARIACAYIAGLQREGVAATIKHFVGNESEFERMTISSEIAERPLRELYLAPFEAAVKEAGTWALMSSYNRLNGTYVSEEPRLLCDILKGEWGFDGVIISDWFATHSTAAALNGGMDLEMPGPTRFRGEQLVAAVESGAVEAATVRDSARRILRLIDRVGAFADPTIPPERAQDRPEDRALIRRAGAAGSVLLHNDGILPLDPAATGTIAVIGPNAKTAQIMGGGSAQLNAHYRVTPFEGIAAQLGPDTHLTYDLGCTNYRLLPLLDSELTVDEAIARAVRLATEADTVILCVGANGEWDGEGQDRPDLSLPGRQDELIARVAAANPRTVVVLQTGGPVAMAWLSAVAAILQAWYPGQECG